MSTSCANFPLVDPAPTRRQEPRVPPGLSADDVVSDQRLAAAVDRRVGQKRLKGVTDTWSDVGGAFDYWAERLRTRLAELRAGQGPK